MEFVMNICEKLEQVEGNSEQGSAGSATREAIAEAISFCGPALVAKYVCHQSTVCHQAESDLAQSLRGYCNELVSGKADDSGCFSTGDLWSGLLWWRDELSWVGKVGVFSREQVVQIAIGALRGYLDMLEAGLSHEEIIQSVSEARGAPPLALRLIRELVCDDEAPGFRAVVSYAVCNF